MAPRRQAAYLESATPYGAPFTGRQFSNDEVYRGGCLQNELRHGQEKADGIIHSDKAKPGQPHRCRAKDQSIHIFRIPAGTGH